MISKEIVMQKNFDEFDIIRVSDNALLRIVDWGVENFDLVRIHRNDIRICGAEIMGVGIIYSRVINDKQTVFYITSHGYKYVVAFKDTDIRDLREYNVELLWSRPDIFELLKKDKELRYIIAKSCFFTEILIAYVSCCPNQVLKREVSIKNPLSSNTRIEYYV